MVTCLNKVVWNPVTVTISEVGKNGTVASNNMYKFLTFQNADFSKIYL